MNLDIPPESKDPAIWGSLTAWALLRMPFLRGCAYFVMGVVTAKFLSNAVAAYTGWAGDAAIYLTALFGIAVIEKALSALSQATFADVLAFIRNFRGVPPPPGA